MTISNYLADLAARLDAEHSAVEEAARSQIEHAMCAGDLLIEAKAQLGHGQWLPWLAERSIAARTATLYMTIARGRAELESKSATVADLTLNGAVEWLSTNERVRAIREFVDDVAADEEAQGSGITRDDIVNHLQRGTPHDWACLRAMIDDPEIRAKLKGARIIKKTDGTLGVVYAEPEPTG